MFHAYSSDSTHSTHKTRSARSACGVRSACTRVCYSAQRRAAHLIERQGCKLFYLSGIKHGRYPKAEVSNLARFISVLKFRPLVWRNAHPSVLADRVEDVTPPELVQADPMTARRVVAFGYVRGTFLKARQRVHIPGLGDYSMA